MISAMVGLSLPFLHPVRLSARAAEADAMLEAARAERSDAGNRLRGDIEAALARLASDVRQARLYRDAILPEAEINARAAREAYSVGSIDFATLVAASVDLRTFRSDYAGTLAAIGGDRADLQMASGFPLLPGTPGMEHENEAK
jgi:outer membrane protein TolC